MFYTTYRHWPFPHKDQSLFVSYDIFVNTIGGIDKDLGRTINFFFSKKTPVIVETEKELAQQTATEGQYAIVIETRNVYKRDGGNWKLQFQVSHFPVTFTRPPTSKDFDYPLGQIWIDIANGELWFLIDKSDNYALWINTFGQFAGASYEYEIYFDRKLTENLYVKIGNFFIKLRDSYKLLPNKNYELYYYGRLKLGTFKAGDNRDIFLVRDLLEWKQIELEAKKKILEDEGFDLTTININAVELTEEQEEQIKELLKEYKIRYIVLLKLILKMPLNDFLIFMGEIDNIQTTETTETETFDPQSLLHFTLEKDSTQERAVEIKQKDMFNLITDENLHIVENFFKDVAFYNVFFELNEYNTNVIKLFKSKPLEYVYDFIFQVEPKATTFHSYFNSFNFNKNLTFEFEDYFKISEYNLPIFIDENSLIFFSAENLGIFTFKDLNLQTIISNDIRKVYKNIKTNRDYIATYESGKGATIIQKAELFPTIYNTASEDFVDIALGRFGFYVLTTDKVIFYDYESNKRNEKKISAKKIFYFDPYIYILIDKNNFIIMNFNLDYISQGKVFFDISDLKMDSFGNIYSYSNGQLLKFDNNLQLLHKQDIELDSFDVFENVFIISKDGKFYITDLKGSNYWSIESKAVRFNGDYLVYEKDNRLNVLKAKK